MVHDSLDALAVDRRVVFDEHGVRYDLVKSLGHGGQGEVWRTTDRRHIVKLLFAEGTAEQIRRQLARVRRLDLGDAHVARPIALLRAPSVGYVAKFLADMHPASDLLAPPRGEEVTRWFLSRGGLRRRLRLLAHAGESLSALHGRGLAYVDLSASNVFVSADDGFDEAWLIDLDNLRYESDATGAVYTLGFGAPEFVSGRAGPTSLSDSWAFAVLVHWVLRLVHPFIGDYVSEGDASLEEEAFAARLPWIEHAQDECNRTSMGIPWTVTMGPRLQKLARDTFESEGHPASKRPSISAWVERLHAAADRTLCCHACGGTYLANASQCPWCDAERQRFVHLALHRWEPGHGVVPMTAPDAVVVSKGETRPLPCRITDALSGLRGRAVAGTVAWRERGLFVIPAEGSKWWVAERDALPARSGREISPSGVTLPTRGSGARLHFGPLDQPHRVALLSEVAS